MAVASSGHEASFLEQDRVALTLPVTGRSEVRVAGRTVVTRPGEIFAIGPSERSSSLIPESEAGLYRSYTIISPPKTGVLVEEGWLHRPDHRSVLRLKHFIEFIFHAFADAKEIPARPLALVEGLIDDFFSDALTPPAESRVAELNLDRYDKVVHAARAHIEAHFTEPLSTPDIARAAGIGSRTLQLAFQNRYGMTPKQFLTEVRLDAMRRQLRSPEPFTTVTSAAAESGLFHFGRCSVAYRERYGESPSETLRCARKSPMH